MAACQEVLQCADLITVLRNGCVAGSLPRAEADEKRMVAMMFGKELIGMKVSRQKVRDESVPPLLELRGVETRGEGAETSLKSIDLKIYPGEILGVAGVSGNGQRELSDIALGMGKCMRGAKILFGKDVTHLSIQKVRRSGVGFIPRHSLRWVRPRAWQGALVLFPSCKKA